MRQRTVGLSKRRERQGQRNVTHGTLLVTQWGRMRRLSLSLSLSVSLSVSHQVTVTVTGRRGQTILGRVNHAGGMGVAIMGRMLSFGLGGAYELIAAESAARHFDCAHR